ncbi:lysylphosphatidylglycerol synthase transmembrane domain-containing protein [Rhodococcus xishaensis]|uniref:lysylphosphatidylglycerol synthase transmembrane domain-containing protein n=1 Tax=Rhodococcus xishaensis TaxID=2487364 RepID=UPI001F2E49F9|nr:YbhN family protein [Rhodococcus xishaensis]
MALPEPDSRGGDSDRSRGRFWWLKWVAGGLLAAVLIGEGIYLWPRLHESWQALSEIHWGWLALCVAAQAVSLSGYGRVQKQLLHAGGVPVSQRRSVAVISGSTAMALTLPAGQVFSTAFTYRETRRWGASPVVASWQLAISGVIAVAGLAAIGMAGALLVGGSVSPFTLLFSVAGLVGLMYAGRYVSAHPDAIERVACWALIRANRIRRKPADAGMEAVRGIVAQLDSVQLGRRDAALTLGWSTVHRMADVVCLGAACFAIGADPVLAGLLVAFAAGKAVATIPGAPGGLLYVDATLIAALTTAASISASRAVAAAFVYRGVSFILVAIVGWIIVAFLFRGRMRGDFVFDADFDDGALDDKALDDKALDDSATPAPDVRSAVSDPSNVDPIVDPMSVGPAATAAEAEDRPPPPRPE